jgi:hypothetical protein
MLCLVSFVVDRHTFGDPLCALRVERAVSRLMVRHGHSLDILRQLVWLLVVAPKEPLSSFPREWWPINWVFRSAALA